MKISLRFYAIECDRCGTSRQATFPCPDCGRGPDATESDYQVQRRQRAVTEVRAAQQATYPPISIDVFDLLGTMRLVRLLRRLFTAANAVAQGKPDGVNQLKEVAREIVELTDWSANVEPLRPVASLTKHVQGAVTALSTAFEVTLQVLSEASLAEAQRASAALQDALDQAAEAADRAGEVLDRVIKLDDNDDQIGGWLAEAVAGDVATAIARGHELFREKAGAICGDTTALAAAVLDIVTATVGDREEFWRQVRDHRHVLLRAGARVDAVLNSPLYLSRAADVTHDLWHYAARAAILPRPETLRQEASDILELGHLVSEQTWKFHLGVACAATTKLSFEDTQAADVSELANIAVGKGWSVAAAKCIDVRNAFAHRDYRIDGDQLLLSPARRGRDGRALLSMKLPEMLDAVLRTIETGSAMELALSSVTEDRGLQMAVARPATFLLRSLLIGLGWTDVDIKFDDRAVYVKASVAGSIQYGAIGLIASPLSGAVDEVVADLRRVDTGDMVTLVVPIAAYTRWELAGDSVAKEIEFIALLRQTTRNSLPLISDNHLSKYVAKRACDVAVDRTRPFNVVNSELKAWRGLAQRFDLRRLQQLVGRAQRWRMNIEANIAVEPSEMHELISTIDTRVDPLPALL